MVFCSPNDATKPVKIPSIATRNNRNTKHQTLTEANVNGHGLTSDANLTKASSAVSDG